MNARTKALAVLVPLALVDAVIPVPIIGLVLVYVILARPPWFSSLVRRVYEPT